MKYKHKNITACGKRIKDEACKRNLSNEDMRCILHFANVKNVSYVYSGKSISDNTIDILCNLWGLRRDYLLCNDDYPTDEDKYNALFLSEQIQYKAAIKYLNTLGIELDVNLYWICSPKAFKSNYKRYRSYIMPSELEHFNNCIINIDSYAKYDYIGAFLFKLDNYPIKDLLDSYDDFEGYEAYDKGNYIFDNTKTNYHSLFIDGVITDINDGRNVIDQLRILYDVTINGVHKDYMTTETARTMFNAIDSSCTNTVNALLAFAGSLESRTQYDDSYCYVFDKELRKRELFVKAYPDIPFS